MKHSSERLAFAAPRLISAGLLCVSLSGCMVGPNYHAPAVPAPPSYKEPAPASTIAVPAGETWWKVFNDATLDELEKQAIAANPDIQIAVAHVDQADAVRRSVHSAQLPTVTAGASVSRNREAQQRPNNGNTYGHAATYNDFQLPLSLSYEIDAWGRIRRMVQSATASQQATEADLRFVRLSVAASVATDYYTLREADADINIVQTTLVDLERGYEITNNQFRRGLISELAVRQAQTILDQTRARVEALHIQRSQSEHAIAVLLGRPVAGFVIVEAITLPRPPVIPAGVPADLLGRRPDIASAERSAAAASAQIGVARAAYLPQISLTGFAGYESTNPASILNWQNSIASMAASAVAPIFTGGRLKANVDQAQASYRESVGQYEKTVLTAYQDVEDQLAALHYLSRQFDAENNAVADAKRAEEIANNRYNTGLVSYLDVVFAQQTLLSNQEISTQVQGQRLVATVALIRALGGSWNK
ncbi:efflux transporter outer membrane subunit [Edaphobacter aggregans]|uniref:efflux transporter outer membrane subunit n=1 Tax=Edaphobacter aggregans TaxID=570835 RepID=UPI0007E8C2F9|nr:efflux transporter outer membrane subunit [Edaphobacter aggregans]